MSTHRKLTTVCCAAVLAFGLAACGSSDDDGAGMMPPMDLAWNELDGETVGPGTYTLTGAPADLLAAAAALTVPEGGYAPGVSVTLGGYTLTCTGAVHCNVTVNDDGSITTTGMIMAATYVAMPEPEPEPTETETAVTDAGEAADAAEVAAIAARAAAVAAANIASDRAWFQTVPASRSSRIAAIAAAEAAEAAAKAARTAADAAEAAETTTAAVEARIAAVAARALAEKQQMYAENARDQATARNMAEVNIDGKDKKDKSVGSSSLNADDGARSVVTDGQAVITGRMKAMDPMETTGMVTGVAFVAGDAGADPAVADTAYVQAVADRMVTIGRTIDTSNDAARLMLVTHYAGTKTVKVYADAGGDNLTGTLRSDGRIQTAGVDTADDATDDRFATLKSKGSYYLAGAADGGDGLTNTDEVGATTKASTVYSYTDDNATPDNADDDTTGFVVLVSSTDTSGVITVEYQLVDVTALASDATVEGTAEEVEVTAKIADPTPYKHLHFGVWASLGKPAKDGSQKIDGLGIGFVTGQADETGLTVRSDMPNIGDATYDGNWVATVQAADEDGNGAVSLVNGVASMTVDFEDGDVTASLTGLATLEGDITTFGNTFNGEKATVGTNTHGLTADAKFDGSMSGGFFGPRAAEAGATFSFTSDDNEDGAFSGAFGGDRP